MLQTILINHRYTMGHKHFTKCYFQFTKCGVQVPCTATANARNINVCSKFPEDAHRTVTGNVATLLFAYELCFAQLITPNVFSKRSGNFCNTK